MTSLVLYTWTEPVRPGIAVHRPLVSRRAAVHERRIISWAS